MIKGVQVLAFALIALTLVSARHHADLELVEQQPSKFEQLWAKFKTDFILLAIGLVCVLFAIPFLYFNERRTINKDKVVHIAEDECKDAGADKVDPELEKHLVHCTNEVACHEPIVDTLFKVQILNKTIFYCYNEVETLLWE